MSALRDLIVAQISSAGPMTVADYMSLCLSHPKHGYYMTRDPLGIDGDFTTAPEISQMFGELCGLALAQAWMDQGSPKDAILVELGPGRGSLMADMLRAMRGTRFRPDVHFVETSPALRAEQSKRVPQAIWHNTIETLPDAPILMIANEFFDALPIRQFQRDRDEWRERVIGLQDGTLAFFLTDPAPHTRLTQRLNDTKDGDVVETCAPTTALMGDIGSRISENGGAALIIDYGDWVSQGDTFQALQRHKSVDPFDFPGQADLTAHVDFAALAYAAAPAKYSRLTPQGVFLERLGITSRAQALAMTLTGDTLARHIAAHRRLTHPAEMGSVFKVLGITPTTAPSLPGLDA